MRPDRDNIAIPPFPPGITWIGTEAPVSERLTARAALLVHFFELGELSSLRTLPFVAALAERYGGGGLSVLGVHTPRSAIAASDEALRAGLERLDVPFPVANDGERRIWHAYGCRGWPSTFLWGQGGTLRYVHFGEGAYHETEAAVRAELAGGEDHDLPEPALGSGARRDGARDRTTERGGLPRRPLRPALEARQAGRAPDRRVRGRRRLGGPGWLRDGRPLPWTAAPRARSSSTARASTSLPPTRAHGMHEVRIELGGPIRVWSVSFAPGAAG